MQIVTHWVLRASVIIIHRKWIACSVIVSDISASSETVFISASPKIIMKLIWFLWTILPFTSLCHLSIFICSSMWVSSRPNAVGKSTSDIDKNQTGGSFCIGDAHLVVCAAFSNYSKRGQLSRVSVSVCASGFPFIKSTKLAFECIQFWNLEEARTSRTSCQCHWTLSVSRSPHSRFVPLWAVCFDAPHSAQLILLWHCECGAVGAVHKPRTLRRHVNEWFF